MEMFEIRYFHAVAEQESIQRASEQLSISPSSLSKAISRLEDEFNVPLFKKDGRRIRLTEKGHLFYQQAQQFLQLEKDTCLKLMGTNAPAVINMIGPEVFLSSFGLELSSRLKDQFPKMQFTFHHQDGAGVEQKILDHTVDVGFLSEPNTKNPKLIYTLLTETSFNTYVSQDHPLAKRKSVPIHELLEYEFLTPSMDALGLSDGQKEGDGWRDDVFERITTFRGVGLKALEHLVQTGKAVAYLPEYYAKTLHFKKLQVKGCPYRCEQKIMMVIRKDSRWILEEKQKRR